MTIRAACLVALVGMGAVDAVRSQEPVFRAVVDAVNVSVAVRHGGRPITGLGSNDFELRDNGVRQEITSSSIESVPVDVALVLDTSESVEGAALDRLKSDVQKMTDSLQPDDRVRLLPFAFAIRDVFGFRTGKTRLPMEQVSAGGSTSFYNALGVALMMAPDADRPRLVFALSDGIDTSSVLTIARVVELASYSSAVLYIDLVPPSAVHPGFATGRVLGRASRSIAPHRQLLIETAARTGGLVYEDPSSLPSVFRKVLSDFRTSYVLRYMPRGVKRDGWHDITVTLPRHADYTIHARKGYEGS